MSKVLPPDKIRIVDFAEVMTILTTQWLPAHRNSRIQQLQLTKSVRQQWLPADISGLQLSEDFGMSL